MPIKLLIPRSSDDAGMTDGSNSVPDLEIVDRVMIPAGTPPGEYVLGWRWDCEMSSQVSSDNALRSLSLYIHMHIYIYNINGRIWLGHYGSPIPPLLLLMRMIVYKRGVMDWGGLL